MRRSFLAVGGALALAAAGIALALAAVGAARTAALTTTLGTTNVVTTTPSPSCNTGALNSSGSTNLSLNGSTATVNVAGWAVCGEQLVVDIHWSDGSISSNTSSASKGLAAGQCIGATAYIGSSAGGVIDNPVGTWTQSSSPSQVCAPNRRGRRRIRRPGRRWRPRRDGQLPEHLQPVAVGLRQQRRRRRVRPGAHRDEPGRCLQPFTAIPWFWDSSFTGHNVSLLGGTPTAPRGYHVTIQTRFKSCLGGAYGIGCIATGYPTAIWNVYDDGTGNVSEDRG